MVHQSNIITIKVLSEYTLKEVDNLYDEVFAKRLSINFFLSREWMLPWLSELQNKPLLWIFSFDNKPVGFAFIGQTSTILGKTFFLNQSGVKDEDQIWIEYNDVICDRFHQECRLALLDALGNIAGSYRFKGTNLSSLDWEQKRWSMWSQQKNKSYKTLFTSEPPYFSLSKNTKSQINRARNYIIKQYGEIYIDEVMHDSLSDSLHEMAQLHIKQWDDHEYGSGFSNTLFYQFHRNINSENIGTKTRILKFIAGEQLLGYLYYFIEKRENFTVAYFYLSAIHYADDNNKFKPGMVMHKMAMEYLAQQGVQQYDFLAGEARYKSSLSNTAYSLYDVHLYRNTLLYSALNMLAKCKRLINKKLLSK